MESLYASEVILQSTAETFITAVLVERVGVPDDYALYSVIGLIEDFFEGTEVKVIVEFLAGNSSDFIPGAEYQISISALY